MSKKSIIIIAYFTMFIIRICYSGIIDGPGNIRDEPNGKTLFSLNDSTFVREIHCINNWYRIEFDIVVDLALYKNSPNLNGIDIFNEAGKKIGTIINYQAKEWDLIKGDKVYIYVDAYTHENNIRNSSTLNFRIKYILSHNKHYYFSDFQHIFKDWKQDKYYQN